MQLTTVRGAQVYFQGPGSREGLGALWEGAQTGGLVGAAVVFLHHRLWLPLSPAAIVHQMGLQVPLAPEPDPTCLAGEDVLWRDKERDKGYRISGHIAHFHIYA